MKSIYKIILLAALFLFGLGNSGDAFSSLRFDLQIEGLSPYITLQKGNQHVLGLSGEAVDLMNEFNRVGLFAPAVYQIRYKNEEDYRYAVFMKAAIGNVAFEKLSGEFRTPRTGVTLEYIMTFIEKLVVKQPSLFVRQPFQLQGDNKSFMAIWEKDLSKKDEAYHSVIYIIAYEDQYLGPSFKAILLAKSDEQTLLPLLTPLLNVKK